MRDPVPPVVPVNVTEQVPAEDNVQLLALSEPPVNVKVNVTVPVGVLVVPAAVSVTVAVHDVAWLIAMVVGLQATVVVVVRLLTVTVVLPELVA